MTTERPDRGARALADAMPDTEADWRPFWRRVDEPDGWVVSIDAAKLADAILANGAAFLPEGFPRGWHAFRNVDPDAECPTCGFPAWSHDPGMAVLHGRTILPDAAELERLRRIEAAARAYLDAEWDADRAYAEAALRAALEPEGSAQAEAADETPPTLEGMGFAKGQPW